MNGWRRALGKALPAAACALFVAGLPANAGATTLTITNAAVPANVATTGFTSDSAILRSGANPYLMEFKLDNAIATNETRVFTLNLSRGWFTSDSFSGTVGVKASAGGSILSGVTVSFLGGEQGEAVFSLASGSTMISVGAVIVVGGFSVDHLAELQVTGTSVTLLGELTLTGSLVLEAASVTLANSTGATVVPPAPSNAVATDDAFDDKVTITWDPVPSATSYEVHRAPAVDGTKTLLGTTTQTTFDDTTGMPGTVFYYFVRGVNDGGTGTFTAGDQGSRPLLTPAVPVNVQASDGTDASRVIITWDAVPYADTYDVWRSATVEGSKTLIGSPATNSFDDTLAEPLVHNYYWIKAVNTAGASDFSITEQGTRGPPLPAAPANLQASDDASSDSITVTWDAAANATAYEIYRAESVDGMKTLAGTVTVTMFVDAEAPPGGVLTYWVKSLNSSGTSDFSVPDEGTRVLAVPFPPVNVQASDFAFTDKVAVTWDAVPFVDSYEVHRAASASGAKTLIATPAGNSFDDTAATPGVTLSYWVKAINEAGTSDFSVPDEGAVLAAPVAPTGTTASRGTFSSQVTVTWEAVDHAASYEVHRSVSLGGEKTLLASPTSTQFDDTTAPSGLAFTYWVRAVNAAGTGVFGAPATGFVSTTQVNNDNFANAVLISGTSTSVVASNQNATAENGEPGHASDRARRSIWWLWSAPSSGTATISTAGSDFDTVVAIYTGGAVSGLTEINSNDDWNGQTSQVSFEAVANQTYSFAVDGYIGFVGTVVLSLDLQTTTVQAAGLARAYVTSDSLGTLSLIDAATGTVTSTFSVGNGSFGLVMHPNGVRAYVANFSGNDVSVVDLVQETVIATIPVGAGPGDIIISPDGKTVYVANENSNSITAIDTASNTVLRTRNVGIGPKGLVLHPNGSRLYTANQQDNTVTVLDAATFNTVATIQTGGTGPQDVVITPNGSQIYVPNFLSRNVSVIDTASNTLTKTIPAGSAPRAAAMLPNGSRLYVTSFGDDRVQIIDPGSNTVTGSVDVGDEPFILAASADSTRVYVVNRGDQSVSIIDTANNTVIETVTLDRRPAGIAADLPAMVRRADDVLLNLGSPLGVWALLNDGDLERVNYSNPSAVLVADVDGNAVDDVILDFGSQFGLWIRRNNGPWKLFNVNATVHLAAADVDGDGRDDVIADFGPGIGTWIKMGDRTWRKFNANSTGGIASGDLDGNGQTDVVISLGEHGIWAKMNNAGWVKQNDNPGPAMVLADLDGNGQDELIIDIGPEYGLWAKRNFGTWEQVSSIDAEALYAADIDGDTKIDLIADHGEGRGLWARTGDTLWTQIHELSPGSLTVVDLDRNAIDDLVADFGPGVDTLVYRNGIAWEEFNPNASTALAAGDIDGL